MRPMTDNTPPEPVQADRFPLSLQLDFLNIVDRGGDLGPFGPKFTVVAGWRVQGEIDLAALRAAMDDLVIRQEMLRTRIVRDAGDPHLLVLPPASPELVVSDLAVPPDADRDRAAEEFLNDLEAGQEFRVDEIPGLR